MLFWQGFLLASGDEIVIDLPGIPDGAKPLQMLFIPAGSFMMGSDAADPGYYAQWEWPLHSVTLHRGFYLSVYEITQAQWMAVMGNHPEYDVGAGNDYPVYSVSWDDCQRFVARCNQLGLGIFRLPTEAEWEYACRAGTETRYSFGDGPEFQNEYLFYEEPSRYLWWFGNNEPFGVKPVGRKLPNPWGLYDMHGNLYEWCSDWWENPYLRIPLEDPIGPPSGTAHVFKGGHWYGSIFHCRSAFRMVELDAEKRGGRFWGFRVVKEIPNSSIMDWEIDR